jgi:hypothetical protein
VFEKWLLAILVVVIAYPLAYTLAFYLCNVPAWWLTHGAMEQLAAKHASDLLTGAMPEGNAIDLAQYALFHPRSDEMGWAELLRTGVVLSVFQAFALFGSLYFRNMPFIKTLFAGFLIMLGMMLLSAMTGADSGLLFGFWESQKSMSPLQSFLFPALWFAIPSMLWLSTFLVLKEREIAP